MTAAEKLTSMIRMQGTQTLIDNAKAACQRYDNGEQDAMTVLSHIAAELNRRNVDVIATVYDPMGWD